LAAGLLEVSVDTVRRWADSGRLQTRRSTGGQRLVDGVDLARLAAEVAVERDAADPDRRLAPVASARNRLPGIVTKVTRDTVMAKVEIQVGRHRMVSLMTREAADELGLAVGVLAAARIKSTDVVVEVVEAP
jgi:molybdopterin-binding protein